MTLEVVSIAKLTAFFFCLTFAKDVQSVTHNPK